MTRYFPHRKRSGSNRGNKPVDDPIYGRFASGLEYKRWLQLVVLQNAGLISNLRRQVRYTISAPSGQKICDYIADAVYVDEQGVEIVEDAKGHRDALYKLKKKCLEHLHGIKITEWPEIKKERRARVVKAKIKTTSKGSSTR